MSRELLPVFRLVDLRKTYGEGEAAVHALRGVDLTIDEGELVVLLGPSGSGKSTLLNVLGGLDRPTAGSSVLSRLGSRHAPATRTSRSYRRLHVGFVFQFYNLIASLTAAENVELVTEVATDPMPAREALELVGLGAALASFPGAALRRRAAARRHRARHRQAPDGAAVRRTDRRARRRHRRARARSDRHRERKARARPPC